MGSQYYCENNNDTSLELDNPNYTSVYGVYLQMIFKLSHLPYRFPISACLPNTCRNIESLEKSAASLEKSLNDGFAAIQKQAGIQLDELYRYVPAHR